MELQESPEFQSFSNGFSALTFSTLCRWCPGVQQCLILGKSSSPRGSPGNGHSSKPARAQEPLGQISQAHDLIFGVSRALTWWSLCVPSLRIFYDLEIDLILKYFIFVTFKTSPVWDILHRAEKVAEQKVQDLKSIFVPPTTCSVRLLSPPKLCGGWGLCNFHSFRASARQLFQGAFPGSQVELGWLSSTWHI